jgi:hypothetical protein
MVEGVEEFENDGGNGKTGEGDGDEGDVFLVGGGGESDIGDGTREGGIHAHRDSEPREVSSAKEKLVGGLFATGEEPSDKKHAN